MNKPFGFTIIELLATVTIIAIIASIGVSVYSGAQANARDGKRREEINAIAKAMELNYGKYKSGQYSGLCQNGFDGAGAPTYDNTCSSWFGGNPGSLPVDPKLGWNYFWCTTSNTPTVTCDFDYPDGSSATIVGSPTILDSSSGTPPLGQTPWYICADLERGAFPYCQKNQQ